MKRSLDDWCRTCHAQPGDGCKTPKGRPTAFHARKMGQVEVKVRGDIAALMTKHPMGEALAEMSYNLARSLDNGAGMAVAAINRELRANLSELAGQSVDVGDLSGAFSTPDEPEQP